jgi:pSer/pThr/pTyr-binding forkhead associated (FHA) protein
VASIIVASGPGGAQEGLFLPLGKRTSIIGRDESLSLQIEDGSVSRKHLQIRYEASDGSYRALDMKSGNGLYINGRRGFDEIALLDGDELQIGATKLLFVLEEPTDKANALTVIKKVGERKRSTLMR